MSKYSQKSNSSEFFTNTKLELQGSFAILTKYQKSFRVGKRRLPSPKKPHSSNKGQSRYRGFDQWRARKRLTTMINTNCYAWPDPETGKAEPPSFVTLTYAPNFQDVPESKKQFRNFLLRLNYAVTGDRTKRNYLKFVAVIEFQRRGAIHYHCVFFNLPYIWNGKLQELWSYGWTEIKLIAQSDITDYGAYISKYIGKDLGDPRLWQDQAYIASRNLKKPTVLYGDELPDILTAGLPLEALHKASYGTHTDFLGDKDQLIFDLTNHPNLQQQLYERVIEQNSLDTSGFKAIYRAQHKP